MEETTRAMMCFEEWLRLGGGCDRETIEAVCKGSGISPSTFFRWKREFKWDERVDERLAIVMSKERQVTDSIIATSREEYRGIIKRLVGKFRAEVLEGKVVIENIGDFDKLARLDLAMMGQNIGTGQNIVVVTAIPRPGNNEMAAGSSVATLDDS